MKKLMLFIAIGTIVGNVIAMDQQHNPQRERALYDMVCRNTKRRHRDAKRRRGNGGMFTRTAQEPIFGDPEMDGYNRDMRDLVDGFQGLNINGPLGQEDPEKMDVDFEGH